MKAVALGLVVDIVGTVLFSIALGMAYAIHLGLTGMNEEQIRSAVSNDPLGSFLVIVGTVAGAGFSVLGGYVCERVARRQNYRVGLVLGCVSACLGVLVGWSSTPPLQHVFFSLLTVVCVLVGTRFGHDNRRF